MDNVIPIDGCAYIPGKPNDAVVNCLRVMLAAAERGEFTAIGIAACSRTVV